MTKNTISIDFLRTCIFRPYRKGLGPVFTLRTWDTHSLMGDMQRQLLGYELKQDGVVLFYGQDFGCSPIDPIDSDRCVAAIMGFLTLRPGDTDADYFTEYTASQLAFTRDHAEDLGCEVMRRFGVDR